jgi:hypothetical protein
MVNGIPPVRRAAIAKVPHDTAGILTFIETANGKRSGTFVLVAIEVRISLWTEDKVTDRRASYRANTDFHHLGNYRIHLIISP